MGKNTRHTIILEQLSKANEPISATSLASHCNVSRQLIVGDIALLRASGHQIVATHKGYILNPTHLKHTKQLVFKHTPSETELELTILVEHHCKILDVQIQHSTYGSITGELNIETLDDIKHFIQQGSPLISTLSDGIHIHTIEYDDPNHLQKAIIELKKHNLLYK